MMLLHMQSPQYCNLSMRKESFIGSRIHPQQPPASRLPSLLRRPFVTPAWARLWKEVAMDILSRDAHGMPKLS
ncbi:hypothetical protein BGW80DRAFT_1378881 [Lactifluus volemus]|nr:hypothetical protein BGW80DRAFT_1378881 [Lactifluus volemus]